MTAFFDMNGYGVFIWPCYALTFAFVIGLYIKAHQSLKKSGADTLS